MKNFHEDPSVAVFLSRQSPNYRNEKEYRQR